MQANLTPESVEAMKVNELKDALGSLGLSIKGLKAELKARLLEALAAPAAVEHPGYPGYPPPAAPAAQPSPWSEHHTPEGHLYYYNATTGQSSWEKPPADYHKAARTGGAPPPGGGTKTKGPPGANLFVVRKMRRGEFDEFYDADLREAFERFGTIVRAEMTLDKDTGVSKGFGFVSYSAPHEADAAMAALQGSTLAGRQIRIEKTSEDGRPA